MTKDTTIEQLVINKLTKAQYQALVDAGTVDETQIYCTTDEDCYTKTEIVEKMAGAMILRGSCTYAELLAKTDMEKGDVWNISDANGNVPAGTDYVYDGSAWDPLGGEVDLSSARATVTVGTTAPTSPKEGDVWYDTAE